jgi:hypothetical protein
MLNLLAVHYVFSSSFPGFLKATLPSPGTPMQDSNARRIFRQVFIPVKPFEEGLTKMQDPLSSHLGGALCLESPHIWTIPWTFTSGIM